MNFPALFHYVIQSGYLLEHSPNQEASYSQRLHQNLSGFHQIVMPQAMLWAKLHYGWFL